MWYVNHACNVDWESTGDIRDVRISIARRYSDYLLYSYKRYSVYLLYSYKSISIARRYSVYLLYSYKSSLRPHTLVA